MPLPVSSLLSREAYEQLLENAANEPDFAYLGSTGADHGRGLFSGFTACAITTKCVDAKQNELINTKQLSSEMESLVKRYEVPVHEPQGLLTGGWVGFLGYEFGYIKESRLAPLCPLPATPLLFAGFYLWAASHNRATDTYHLWVHPECPEDTQRALESWQNQGQPEPSQKAERWHMTSPFKARQPAEGFTAGVGMVQEYIKAGDCYHVNLSQEFEGRYKGNPWQAFQALAEANPTPYSAFLRVGLASASA